MPLAVSLQDFQCAAQEPRPILSGKQLEESLKHRQSLNASGVSLRRCVTDLQSRNGIAIVLDRRTDPLMTVDIDTEYVTTGEVLVAIAAAVPSASASITDQYALIGPAAAAGRLRTLHAINRQSIEALRRAMDSEMFRKLVQPADVSWDNLAEPRQLLSDRAAAIGLTIQNADQVPHDLWAAATLPALPFADFATLVLNQFDLTFELSAEGRMKIISVPANVTVEQRHRVPSREKDSVLKRWMAAFPRLTVTWTGSTATVNATIETHEKLKDLVSGEPAAMVAAASIRDRKFTMKVPAGTAMGQLIVTFQKSGVPIRIEGRSDAELTPLLQQTTEFDLSGVAGEDFFPQIFAAWNANVVVNDSEVVVTFPRKSAP